MFLAHFHPELVGPNLDQAQGSAWTRHGAQPGPGTGLSLEQARGLAWASVAHVGQAEP